MLIPLNLFSVRFPALTSHGYRNSQIVPVAAAGEVVALGGKRDAGNDEITSTDNNGKDARRDGKEDSISSAGIGAKGTRLVSSFDLPNRSSGRHSQSSSSFSYADDDA